VGRARAKENNEYFLDQVNNHSAKCTLSAFFSLLSTALKLSKSGEGLLTGIFNIFFLNLPIFKSGKGAYTYLRKLRNSDASK